MLERIQLTLSSSAWSLYGCFSSSGRAFQRAPSSTITSLPLKPSSFWKIKRLNLKNERMNLRLLHDCRQTKACSRSLDVSGHHSSPSWAFAPSFPWETLVPSLVPWWIDVGKCRVSSCEKTENKNDEFEEWWESGMFNAEEWASL